MDYKKVVDDLMIIIKNNENHFEELSNKAMKRGDIMSVSIMNAQCSGWTGARYALELLLERENEDEN